MAMGIWWLSNTFLKHVLSSRKLDLEPLSSRNIFSKGSFGNIIVFVSLNKAFELLIVCIACLLTLCEHLNDWNVF